ncbi:hypothetical protein OAJ50_03960 [Candidatus Nitrosopelagicus sp.]|nr:hypothetical protein [Candidatus Nitrosopelagicus sp.]
MTVCRCSDPCEIGCTYFGEIDGLTYGSNDPEVVGTTPKPVCKKCIFVMWGRAR